MPNIENQTSINSRTVKNPAARHHNPFAVLGLQRSNTTASAWAFAPNAKEITMLPGDLPLTRTDGSEFFEWSGKTSEISDHYQLRQIDNLRKESDGYDPYCFPPQFRILNFTCLRKANAGISTVSLAPICTR